MSRVDCFLIWGNGFPVALDIIKVIRNDPGFVIRSIHRVGIQKPIGKFIEELYSTDPVPWEHLRAKTRYLFDMPRKLVCVICENKEPDEKMFGEGPFRHIQCAKVKKLKEKIRDLYNPYENGKRTEKHVIHGTDFESQTEHILKILGLKQKAFYLRKTVCGIRASIYIKAKTLKRKKILLRDLLVGLINKTSVPLKDSLPYRYIQGDRQPYIECWKKNWGVSLVEDHSPEAFDALIRNYKYDPSSKDLIIVSRKRENGGHCIIDGAHRAAILLSRGETEVSCAVKIE
jgi:hypothetical protein